MTPNQRDWLRSLVRMAIRKSERNLDKLAPKPGWDFGDFAEHQRNNLAFQNATLAMLNNKEREAALSAWHDACRAMYLAAHQLWRNSPESAEKEAFRQAAVAYDRAFDRVIVSQRTD